MATRGFEHVTEADVMRMQRKHVISAMPKPSKYRNVRQQIGNEWFDSKREADWWMQLKAREAAKEIRNLKRQKAFPLYAPTLGGKIEVANYIADFVFEERESVPGPDGPEDMWRIVVADVKGGKATQTALFKLKAKWLALQDGITIRIL